MLVESIGMEKIAQRLGRVGLRAYRDAIITRKLAAMALYRHAADWDGLLARLQADMLGELEAMVLCCWRVSPGG
jgi:glutamate dehydrogenase